jgi:hypothetical protein
VGLEIFPCSFGKRFMHWKCFWDSVVANR